MSTREQLLQLAAQLEKGGKQTYGDAIPVPACGFTLVPTPLVVKVIAALQEAAEAASKSS